MKTKNPLPRKRWEYLKALQPSPGVLIHESCDARMVPSLTNPMGPMVPWVEKPGHTYNVGRNKAKRARRAAERDARRQLVASRA